jgi:hypothetical protein
VNSGQNSQHDAYKDGTPHEPWVASCGL